MSRAPRTLQPREQAVLAVLVAHDGRLVDRPTLRHDAALEDLSERRCESLLVEIRRILGENAVITVRGRGWRLDVSALDAARALLVGAPTP